MENGDEWVTWLHSLERIVDMVQRGRKLEVEMEGKAQHGYSVMIRDIEEPDCAQGIVWGVPTFKWANDADDVCVLLERLLKKFVGGPLVQTRRHVDAATSQGLEVSSVGRRPIGVAAGPPSESADIFTTPPVEEWTTWADWLHLLHLTHIGHRLEVRVDDQIGRGSTLTMIDLDATGDHSRVVWESAFLDRSDADRVGSFMQGNLERLATRALLYDEVNARIIAELRASKGRRGGTRTRPRMQYLLDAFPRHPEETPPAWFERVEAELTEARAKRGQRDVPEEALAQGGGSAVETGAMRETNATREVGGGTPGDTLNAELLSDLRAALSAYPRVQGESLKAWFDRVIREHVTAPEYPLAHALGLAEGAEIEMLSSEFEAALQNEGLPNEGGGL